MNTTLGQYLRQLREKYQETDKDFSLRKVAVKLGIEPSYLSKIERDLEKTPSEDLIIKIAHLFGEDKDVLLAMTGKVSSELQNIILKNPKVFAQLLHHLKDAPDHAILKVVREVTDGNW